MQERRELFNWFFSKEKTFTAEEVEKLVETICEFNCGAIDDYLTVHANKAFDEWLKDKQQQ